MQKWLIVVVNQYLHDKRLPRNLLLAFYKAKQYLSGSMFQNAQ